MIQNTPAAWKGNGRVLVSNSPTGLTFLEEQKSFRGLFFIQLFLSETPPPTHHHLNREGKGKSVSAMKSVDIPAPRALEARLSWSKCRLDVTNRGMSLVQGSTTEETWCRSKPNISKHVKFFIIHMALKLDWEFMWIRVYRCGLWEMALFPTGAFCPKQ